MEKLHLACGLPRSPLGPRLWTYHPCGTPTYGCGPIAGEGSDEDLAKGPTKTRVSWRATTAARSGVGGDLSDWRDGVMAREAAAGEKQASSFVRREMAAASIRGGQRFR